MTINLGILASTNGTNIPPIVKAIENKDIEASIKVIISNTQGCGALEKAKLAQVKGVFIDPTRKKREDYDKEIAKILDAEKIDLILLIGWMRILSPWFVKEYKNKVMNIHPSLLPAFSGGMDINVHSSVLEHGCKVSGCSLIFIDEGEDTGPIIIQKPVQIQEIDTPETLKEKVQKLEQEALIEGIKLFGEKRLQIKGRIVHILPKK